MNSDAEYVDVNVWPLENIGQFARLIIQSMDTVSVVGRR